MNKVRRALVFADHSQFYIQDIDGQMAAEADEGYDWPEAWSEEAVAVYRIGLDGPCSIAIGTARSDHVETTLRVHGGEPPLVEAEHIVEAALTVPTWSMSSAAWNFPGLSTELRSLPGSTGSGSRTCRPARHRCR